MEEIAGEFAIQTYLKGRYLTAVGGGGKTTDVVHTDAQTPQAWEKFRFWADSATRQYYAFQTANGHFITANNGGGLTADAIHSDATTIGGWEMFRLLPQLPFGTHAIQTLRGNFLTAVGGGFHASGDTIHTDAVATKAWEFFHVLRRGDLGTGTTYGIQAWGGNVFNPWLTATAGGRRPGPTDALVSAGGPPYWISWTLLKQADGSYAFQTASGGMLTAIGGGVVGQGFRTDTETDQIGNWEKFTLVDFDDFTACIRTHAGTYLRANLGGRQGDGQVVAVLNVDDATRWRFLVVGL